MLADTLTTNITYYYATADAAQREEGSAWYPSYYDKLADVARKYSLPTEHVVAAFAALSPQVGIDLNLRWLRDLVDAYAIGDELPRYGLPRSLTNAVRALEDGPGSLSGPKVLGFFASLVDPNTTNVCIDRHAARVALGEPYAHVPAIRGLAYATLSDAYARAARDVSVAPRAIQATTWLVMRDLRGPRRRDAHSVRITRNAIIREPR